MNDIIVGSIIVWALGRVLKKKADQPAPGSINLPPQQRVQQFPSKTNGAGYTGGGVPGPGRPPQE